eukprot:CAMPEP_0175047922 /NCGR_PEP_ID=MMETSP0052_2-20121109/5880_1 /TAXON_ID=51329 ORGANISM="Polytomella parva, Strain SAG 63-3" /NCGR_SAMPLE_ID=MMETSP0052_2 /ASSEMBLY_ACC=CAM_ASM_000194 /LENGTH=559 /DNA_ID=CAMNT_0016311883 /DNA_START=81 /DNA_END=1756 /DNA_ORIENTATION=-
MDDDFELSQEQLKLLYTATDAWGYDKRIVLECNGFLARFLGGHESCANTLFVAAYPLNFLNSPSTPRPTPPFPKSAASIPEYSQPSLFVDPSNNNIPCDDYSCYHGTNVPEPMLDLFDLASLELTMDLGKRRVVVKPPDSCYPTARQGWFKIHKIPDLPSLPSPHPPEASAESSNNAPSTLPFAPATSEPRQLWNTTTGQFISPQNVLCLEAWIQKCLSYDRTTNTASGTRFNYRDFVSYMGEKVDDYYRPIREEVYHNAGDDYDMENFDESKLDELYFRKLNAFVQLSDDDAVKLFQSVDCPGLAFEGEKPPVSSNSSASSTAPPSSTLPAASPSSLAITNRADGGFKVAQVIRGGATRGIYQLPLSVMIRSVANMEGGSKLIGSSVWVLWYDQPLDFEVPGQGDMWAPHTTNQDLESYGIWYRAIVQSYDSKSGFYIIQYILDSQISRIALPLSYVHFGPKPPSKILPSCGFVNARAIAKELPEEDPRTLVSPARENSLLVSPPSHDPKQQCLVLIRNCIFSVPSLCRKSGEGSPALAVAEMIWKELKEEEERGGRG